MVLKKITEVYQLFKAYGAGYSINRMYQRMLNGQKDYYKFWIEKNEIQDPFCILEYCPQISVVVPVYNVKEEQLIACIESVMEQTYENWQLCLVDDASTMSCVREVLQKYENIEKISILYRKENGHISKCTNDGISKATGEFIAFLDCDDFLAENALFEVAKKINENPKLDFLYSDEDLVSEDGKIRHTPIFKPDWSPDTYLSHNYTNHLSVYRASIVKELGGLRSECNGSQDYDFVLRFTEKTSNDRIAHIPKVLYHWRVRPESVASGNDAKPYVFDAAKRATLDAIKRRNCYADVAYIENVRQYNLVYKNQEKPLISIVVCTQKTTETLDNILQEICKKTEYKNYELIILDNSTEIVEKKLLAEKYHAQYINCETLHEISGKDYNNAIKVCQGNYIVFLQENTEIMNSQWLNLMLGHSYQKHIGVVGGKTLYPNKKFIDNIGYFLMNGKFVKIYNHIRNLDSLQAGVNNNFLIVSDTCYMISKNNIEKYGYFNESLNGFDVFAELCMRFYQNGLYNVYRPDVCMAVKYIEKQNIESISEYLKMKYPQFCDNDPFYNQNFSQVLPYQVDSILDIKEAFTKKRKKINMTYTWNAQIRNHVLCFKGNIIGNKKRTFLDQVWIRIISTSGKEVYARTNKEYLGGYERKKDNNNGRKWSGFSGCIDLTHIGTEIKQISIILVPFISCNAYECIINEKE